MAAPDEAPWCTAAKRPRFSRAKYHVWLPVEMPARVLDALAGDTSPDARTLCGIPLFFGFRSGVVHMQPGPPRPDQRCKICARGLGA